MPFIGNQPALSYTSFAKQDFTTSATTSYTLDHPVTNENEIALFINFVRQEPTTAYSASNTNLTLTSATSASDDMYCVFLGKAVQTVNPPVGSVGASQISDGSIALGKLSATGTKDATTFLRGDNTFASAGGVNTPAFFAYLEDGTQSGIANTTFTKIQFNAELFDIGSGFNTSTNTYTIPEAGKYLFSFQVRKSNFQTNRNLLEIRLNDSGIRDLEHGSHSNYGAVTGSFVRQFSANYTINAFLYQESGSNQSIRGGTNAKDTWMYGFKIIE